MQAGQPDDPQRTGAALMAASRAFVGITARSLAALDADVTLPQFRALVVLAMRGPQRPADISAELKVAPSTGTRMCDRLVRKGLVRRARTPSDRRVVRLRLTPGGADLVDEVISRRREELATIVGATSEHWRPTVPRPCTRSPRPRASFRSRNGGWAGRTRPARSRSDGRRPARTRRHPEDEPPA